MNRRGFLGFLAKGAGAIAVGPAALKIVTEAFPEPCWIGANYNVTSATMSLAILKELYSDEYLADLVYKDNPFLKLAKKDPWPGATMPIPLK